MRRLAKHSRDDKYASQKDYQTIAKQKSLRIKFPEKGERLVFSAKLQKGNLPFIGFGGYIRSPQSCTLRVAVQKNGDISRERRFEINKNWSRIGVVTDYDGEKSVTVTLEV